MIPGWLRRKKQSPGNTLSERSGEPLTKLSSTQENSNPSNSETRSNPFETSESSSTPSEMSQPSLRPSNLELSYQMAKKAREHSRAALLTTIETGEELRKETESIREHSRRNHYGEELEAIIRRMKS